VTDLLTVSFSSNDYVGHRVGPDAPEVRDMAIRADQLLAKLFRLIEQRIGLKNVVVVLSADHGVAPAPGRDEAEKMPGGYLTGSAEKTVQAALGEKFGKAEWLLPGGGGTSLYFDREALENAKTKDGRPVTADEAYRTAGEAILANPQLHVARVYSRTQLENGITGDFVATAAVNGFYPRRSGDLQLVLEPGFIPGTSGTTHFSPYAYDRHVPVLIMGPGIKPGRYNQTIEVNDIAPTLATLLDIQTPSGSAGRALSEILQ
jgi:arylsulfatase A-like enzyme